MSIANADIRARKKEKKNCAGRANLLTGRSCCQYRQQCHNRVLGMQAIKERRTTPTR